MKSYLYITAIVAALTGSLAASGCGLSDDKFGSAKSALSGEDGADGGVGSGGGSDTDGGVGSGGGSDVGDGGIGAGSGSDTGTGTGADGDGGIGIVINNDGGLYVPPTICTTDADCLPGYLCTPNLANPGPCSVDGCPPPESTCLPVPGQLGG